MTGGEWPTAEQRRAAEGLASWLVHLLGSMPLDQNLDPRADDRTSPEPLASRGERAAGAVDSGTGSGSEESRATPAPARTIGLPQEPSAGELLEESGEGPRVTRVDDEIERTRRRMREEARSAVLRALAMLLAGCDGGLREFTGTKARIPGVVPAAGDAGEAPGGDTSPLSPTREARPDEETQVNVPPDAVPSNSAQAEAWKEALIPLCLRLLSECGGRSQVTSKEKVAASMGVPRAVRDGDASSKAATEPRGIPPGRKAELLQVIGNGCFRCCPAQDAVRGAGGLPLVLNHCGVDDANPLLRYATSSSELELPYCLPGHGVRGTWGVKHARHGMPRHGIHHRDSPCALSEAPCPRA